MALTADIEKRLGNFTLRVSLEAEQGVLALLGASGCGKSMTLKCIAGIEKPDRGRITLDGRVLFDSEKHINLPPQKREVGYLFQQYALFPNMTVAQNIRCGLRDKRRAPEVLPEILAAMHLEGLEDAHPNRLSGGQQQRVALARILVNEPRLLLLDEPFSALDFLTRIAMQEWLLAQWQRHKKTILFITHDVEEAVFLSDRVLVVESTPIHTLTPVEVPAAYPRSRECLALPELAELKEQLIAILRKQVTP